MSATIGLPQFSHIDTVSFPARLEGLLENNLQRITHLLESNPHYTWDNLMYPLEDLEDALHKLWAPLSHLTGVMDSKALRGCYEACLPLLSAYKAKIGHNQRLYEAIKSLDESCLNPTQRKIRKDNLRDFELAGVALSKEDKKRFEAVQARLAELSNQFSNNVLDAAQAFSVHITDSKRTKGLPQHALDTAEELAKEKGLKGYVFNLEAPCFLAVITYAQDRALREALYHAYVTRASDQGPSAGQFDNSKIMAEILALRYEKAKLLGFKNYAELSLATKMAQSTTQVIDFMKDLVKRARAQAEREFCELNEFAAAQKYPLPLQPWDIAFVSEQRRQHLFHLSQEDLRPYFPLPKVMQGLFAIIKNLYGMTLEEVKGVDVWHKDVQCFCIVDECNTVRGYIYTDLFARPHKHSGAWMDSIQNRRKLQDGRVQFPVATLTCNFAKASDNKLAMLSHDEMLTLFHEFGHCLHHILTQVDYADVSGINGVEWDAVELPSQFFENWCWEQSALNFLAEHVQTKESLPEKLYKQMLAAKNFQSAMGMLRQMEYSLFDFLIHHKYDPHQSTLVTDVLTQVRESTQVAPLSPYNRFQHSFNHIFSGGYAAGYYSYSWAEVLSSDAFSRFEEEGVFNPQTGRDFLRSILEVGGSKEAAEAYREFRGRDATIDALLKHHGIA
jgi:oligopeptidase A